MLFPLEKGCIKIALHGGKIWVCVALVYVVSDKKESLLVIPRLVSDTGLRVLLRVAKIAKSKGKKSNLAINIVLTM